MSENPPMPPISAANGRRALGEHALVIGGSIAGLVAARVLSAYFTRVTVVDRDTFPSAPDFRSGAPQGRHVHVLLTRGLRELNRLFPGLTDDALARGVATFDWVNDVYVHSPFGPIRRSTSGLEGIACSRNLIEWMLRQRLSQEPGVTFLDWREVVGLLADRAGGPVVGLRMRARNAGSMWWAR